MMTDFCAKQSGILVFVFLRPPVEPSRPILRPLDGDHPDHDPLHVHFTRSVAEKPSAVPPKPKLERRPTSGRGLLSIPLNDLLDDSDSDDGDISVRSLASSSSFEVSQVVENQEKAKKVQKQGITFNDAADKVLSSDVETRAADATVRDKKDASGVANQQRKRASSKFLIQSQKSKLCANFDQNNNTKIPTSSR